jgi:hypothetical protein
VVLKMIKPFAGEAIALRWAVSILGGKKPLLVLLTSNWADAAGVVVPIPTFCPLAVPINTKSNENEINFLITEALLD